MTMTGHCLCGAVRYHVDTEPTITANCHCTDCQRQTGSAFSILVAVPREALHIEGELATHVTVGTDTELEVKRQFCPRCGSPIVSLPDMTPDLAYIKAGTLDNAADLVPEMDVWCDSAQHWVTMDEEARGGFPRGVPLVFE
jgi:hypothetical protein